MASSTLVAILNSLHSHLQTQTQLLPPLIHQLGLPPAAVESELQALQETLLESVETRVEIRRREVEEWMNRCTQVEDRCLRYAKALGGGIKATGSTVGELRKEQVLPKRYELMSEHQEKLRQLYHTKLEQLTNLSNRILALTKSLTAEFFPPDVLEPALAQGEDPTDPHAHRDVTPERFARLEKELVRGKSEVSKRLNELVTIFAQLDWMYTELGVPLPSADDLSAASTSIDPFLSDPFIASATPTPAPRSAGTKPTMLASSPSDETEADYLRIFSRFVAYLEEMESEELPEGSTFGLDNVDPTPGLVQWATLKLASLEDLKRRREAHIQAMYDQLEGLWRRLGVSEEDMEGFVEAHRGSTEETVRQYEEELERMTELKRERMGAFIESAREEIRKLWADLMISEEEMADYAPFADDEHTEELLAIHEDEIRKLKEERRMKAPLLASIKKYFEICEEEKELAAAASDQSRLLGRGARDPGRLLREEKMRKRVAKEKPRLEQDLLASLPVWEEEAGRPFLVYGENILRMIADSAAEQESKRKPRAGSVPARATTPVSKTNQNVPGSVGHQPRGTVRYASQTHAGPPAKRQRIEGPPARAPATHRRTVSGTTRPHLASSTKAKPPSQASRAAPPSARPATRQQAMLGHGRPPSTQKKGATASTAQKISRVKRESFKPRPSIDRCDPPILNLAGTIRTPFGLTTPVTEEDEL